MIKPPHLQPGMTIGIIAPASSVRNLKDVDAAIAGLQALGFHVKPGRHIRDRHGFLASNDKNRLNDLHRMFADKNIHAIMCLRGGYGTSRLIDSIDYDLITANPKIFIGFSDITMLSLAFLRKSKLITFNGPMAASTFACTHPSRFTLAGFLRTVCHPQPAGSIWQEHHDHNYRVIRHGKARGRLTGGNLSLIAASIGTPCEIQTRGRIVFIEEIEEKPYQVDRMLTQLLSAGHLRDAAAIAIGRNIPHPIYQAHEQKTARKQTRMVKPIPARVSRTFEPVLDDVFYDRLRPLGIPVLSGLPFGHIDHYATLPLGVMASINTHTGDLIIEESAVK